MGRACCVLGCPSGGDAPSHQIPKNPALFQKWKGMIYSEKIQHLTDEQISKCAVCYRHFADDDYLVTFRVRKLKRGVAPSLNLPNKSASNIFDVIKSDSQVSIATNTSVFPAKGVTDVTENQQMTGVSETIQISLFEDTVEETGAPLYNQPPILLDEDTKQINLEMAERFKLKLLRKKQKKLAAVHLPLLRLKEQAKQYEKTSTIQKLLSFLTPTEIASIKTKVLKSKYSPKVYVRVYHDIAKQKALSQC
ncbi:hypothetical protein PUN28_008143 [Cardiocondyla obscurior]|uniref:THAP-type domain-containing protein n=1 Tax=Cardiocondyla obscurior TaxID=286306 RepID=A0AAW2FZI3_9HYME